MAQGNLAYDLSVYAPKPEQSKKRLEMVGSGRASVKITSRGAAAFLLVVSLLGLIVYNQVVLNEVAGEITRINREIAIMESESVRYTSLLESTVSLRAIAQAAEEELGLVRLDQYQIKYLYLYEQDQVILSERAASAKDDSDPLTIVDHLTSGVKEYLGG